MAIVINGSGTVTGLSVGGLPDGTVDSDTLASSAVTEAKLANNAVVTGKIADGTIANADINSSAAIDTSKLNEISFGASMSSNQSISHNSWTKIELDSELWDTASAYDTSNYRFTVPSGGAGRYSINAGIEMNNTNADKICQITIRKNGNSVPGGTHRDISPFNSPDVKFTMGTIMNLSVGDYIEVWMYHDTGETENLAAHETFFGAFKI